MRVARVSVIGAMAAFLAGGLATHAHANTVLLDLEDASYTGANGTPYSLSFVASDATTTIEFAGYDLPSAELVEEISLTLNGTGSNLLGLAWAFTPAPSTSQASQFPDVSGTGTNGLRFAGFTEDSFDRFAQTVGTTPGNSYTLHFLFANFADPIPTSELVVSTSATAPAVPEPASMLLLGTGIVGAGARHWRKRRAHK